MPTPRRTLCLFAIAFLATAAVALSQQPLGEPATPGPASTSPAAQVPATPGRVTVDVLAVDKLGHPVRGLEAQDFSLTDNGQPQKIADFKAVDADANPEAVQILIVVDMINTGFDVVARERQQLDQYLKQDGGKLAYPTALAVMTEQGVKMMEGSTRDGSVLLANFEKYRTALRAIGPSAGFYGAAERIEWSLSQMSQIAATEATRPGRKLVLMISPGWPLLAGAGYQEDMKQRGWVFNSVVQLSNGLREAHVVLYCLDPYDLGRHNPFEYQSYLKGVKRVDQAEYPYLALQVIAEHSGGRTLLTGRDILGEINDAMRDAGSYYELTFDAQAADRPNEYHELKVKADKPGVTVHTNLAYYANPRPFTGKAVSPSSAPEPAGVRGPQ